MGNPQSPNNEQKKICYKVFKKKPRAPYLFVGCTLYTGTPLRSIPAI